MSKQSVLMVMCSVSLHRTQGTPHCHSNPRAEGEAVIGEGLSALQVTLLPSTSQQTVAFSPSTGFYQLRHLWGPHVPIRSIRIGCPDPQDAQLQPPCLNWKSLFPCHLRGGEAVTMGAVPADWGDFPAGPAHAGCCMSRFFLTFCPHPWAHLQGSPSGTPQKKEDMSSGPAYQ